MPSTPGQTPPTPGKATKPVGYFEEDSGKKSSMRLMSFVALISAIVFGFLTILQPGGGQGVYITFGFLLAAFAPKALQKFAETKVPSSE